MVSTLLFLIILIVMMELYESCTSPRTDLEVHLMQQNHCDGVLSNDWNTLLGEQISMSRSALEFVIETFTLPVILLKKIISEKST